jgi:hypothetical protein
MPDQLFIYYIENPLVIISINGGNGEIMVIRLEIETGAIGKGGTKREGQKKKVCVGEVVWGLLGFVDLMCVGVYFQCGSGGCLCHGLQGVGVCTVCTVG